MFPNQTTSRHTFLVLCFTALPLARTSSHIRFVCCLFCSQHEQSTVHYLCPPWLQIFKISLQLFQIRHVAQIVHSLTSSFPSFVYILIFSGMFFQFSNAHLTCNNYLRSIAFFYLNTTVPLGHLECCRYWEYFAIQHMTVLSNFIWQLLQQDEPQTIPRSFARR